MPARERSCRLLRIILDSFVPRCIALPQWSCLRAFAFLRRAWAQVVELLKVSPDFRPRGAGAKRAK